MYIYEFKLIIFIFLVIFYMVVVKVIYLWNRNIWMSKILIIW